MNTYTVCFLFDDRDLARALFILKNKTAYAGKFNGVGGKMESGENARECTKREIKEETGADVHHLHLVGKIETPDVTGKAPLGSSCRLYYYAGLVDASQVGPQPGETEQLAWLPCESVFIYPGWYAGEDGTFQDMFRKAWAKMSKCHDKLS